MSEVVTIPEERTDLALRATHEISDLIETIEREVEATSDKTTYALRLLLRRARDLNDAIMAALGDEVCKTEEICRVVEAGMSHG